MKLSKKSTEALVAAMRKKTETKLRERLAKSAKRKSFGIISTKDDEVKIDLPHYIRGAILGDWTNADVEKRAYARVNKALGETLGTTGGFLVPTEQNRELIELIRAKTVVRAMPGVRVYGMNSNSMEMPRMDSGTTASWGGENETIASTAVTFGNISMVLRKCVGKVVIPNELIEDASPSITDLVNRDLVDGVAKAVDVAYLEGTGGSQPLGIYRQPHINWTDLSASASFDDVMNAIYQIRLDNHEINGWVTHPRLENSLLKLKDGDGNYLYQRGLGGPQGGVVNAIPTLAGFPIKYTTNIPITNRPSTNESYLIGADWSQFIIGEKGVLRLEASRDEEFSKDQTILRAVYRTDCALRHPEAFVLIKGIQA